MNGYEVQEFARKPTVRLRNFIGEQRFGLHLFLFVLTFLSTTMAGVEWRGSNPFELSNFSLGLSYSLLLLLFLSAHEFGHFVAARIHGVKATLPYYIPLPGFLLGAGITFGTLGAVIRTKSRIPSRAAMFDIGIAGPLAGFVVCLGILIVGFLTLPDVSYLRAIHPDFPNEPPGNDQLIFGNTILFSLLRNLFVSAQGFMPPMSEVYHYPLLCVGWFGLFVTSLNMLPVGQLDGGHIVFTMLSSRIHRFIGIATVSALLILSLPDLTGSILMAVDTPVPSWLEAVTVEGGSTWFIWALIVTFVIRFGHPPNLDESPLGRGRIALGIVAFVIFVLSFTPTPLILRG